MVSEQLSALERVCDKRHAKMMQLGLTEKEASREIVLFLESWIERQQAQYKINFGNVLKSAYATNI